MKKVQVLKKVAELGQKVAIKASGDASLYLLFQPKEPEIMKKNISSKDGMTEKVKKTEVI
jgi:cyclic lactone autoinducer peptide